MFEVECHRLHDLVRSRISFAFDNPPNALPSDGVYFIFEAGEEGHQGQRIVRIGSHTGHGNLAPRLTEHLRPNKDRSIFRKHVGRALLNKSNDPYLKIWNLDMTTRMSRDRHGHLIDHSKQDDIEKLVTKYIVENFRVVVLPSKGSTEACRSETLSIGTVSNCSKCGPSSDWLGSFANPKIATSGLWQMKDLYGEGLSDVLLHEMGSQI
jgi:hypothetical protein